jgi:hypothetical protein
MSAPLFYLGRPLHGLHLQISRRYTGAVEPRSLLGTGPVAEPLHGWAKESAQLKQQNPG